MDPLTIAAFISAGIGGIGTWGKYFSGRNEDPYMHLGMTPGDFLNVNPYTAGYHDQLQGLIGGTSQQLAEQNASLSQATNALEGAYDPNAWLERFGRTGQSTIAEILAPFGEAASSYAGLAGTEAAREVENRYAGEGGSYSGAAQQAAAQGIATPIAQARMQQAQLGSQLGGQLMGQFQQDEVAQYQNALQLAQLLQGTVQGTQGQLGNYYGMLGNISQPEFFNQMVPNPEYTGMSGWDVLSDIGGLGTSVLPLMNQGGGFGGGGGAGGGGGNAGQYTPWFSGNQAYQY